MSKEQEIKKAISKCNAAFEKYRRSKGVQFAEDVKSTSPNLSDMRRVNFEFNGKSYSTLEWR